MLTIYTCTYIEDDVDDGLIYFSSKKKALAYAASHGYTKITLQERGLVELIDPRYDGLESTIRYIYIAPLTVN